MRKESLLHFGMILALPVAAACSTADFNNLIHEGRGKFLAGDVAAAAEYFARACPSDFLHTFTPARAAACQHYLATVDEARAEYPGAEGRYRSALELWTEAGVNWQASRCVTLLNLGELLRKQGRSTEAENVFKEGVTTATELGKERPELYPEALSRLGGVLGESDHPENGREPLTQALRLFAALPIA